MNKISKIVLCILVLVFFIVGGLFPLLPESLLELLPAWAKDFTLIVAGLFIVFSIFTSIIFIMRNSKKQK